MIADRDVLGDCLQKRDLFIEPDARRARVVQAEQTEHITAENDRHDQQRARAETRREETHFLIEAGRTCIVEAHRLRQVEVFRELPQVNRNRHALARRHIFGGSPFMADAQFGIRSELDHIAAIRVHHPS